MRKWWRRRWHWVYVPNPDFKYQGCGITYDANGYWREDFHWERRER